MAAHRFLVDHDCHRLAELLPRALTLADVGLPEDASDRRIVEAAWDSRYIIVSANGRDFLEQVGRFLRTTKKNDCHELWGLVVVPNDHESQKLLIPRAEGRLRLDGKRVTWAQVWRENLYVRIRREGGPEVRRLPRCFYCQKARR